MLLKNLSLHEATFRSFSCQEKMVSQCLQEMPEGGGVLLLRPFWVTFITRDEGFFYCHLNQYFLEQLNVMTEIIHIISLVVNFDDVNSYSYTSYWWSRQGAHSVLGSRLTGHTSFIRGVACETTITLKDHQKLILIVFFWWLVSSIFIKWVNSWAMVRHWMAFIRAYSDWLV